MNKKELNLDSMIYKINKANALFLDFLKDLSRKPEIPKMSFIDLGDYARLILWEVATQLNEYIKSHFPKINREKEFPRLLHCRNSFAHADDSEVMEREIFKDGNTSLPDYLIEVINKIKKMKDNKKITEKTENYLKSK